MVLVLVLEQLFPTVVTAMTKELVAGVVAQKQDVRTCVSCLPLSRGHCENRDSNPAAVRIAPPSLDPRHSASDTLPANHPFSCSPVTPRSLPVGLDHVPSDHVSHVALVPESLPVALPPAVPTEVPDFHWGQHDAGSFLMHSQLPIRRPLTG